MKLCVFGGRDFSDYLTVGVVLDQVYGKVKHKDSFVLINGDAVGADRAAKLWAERKHIPYVLYPPQYDKYPPKCAPIRRNETMAEISTHAIGFWDGSSRGTKSMIDFCKKHDVELSIYIYTLQANGSYKYELI